MSRADVLPGLTWAEADLVDHYLAAADQLGRINPAGGPTDTYRCLRAAQALASEARALVAALTTMRERGEREIFADALTRMMRDLDGERRTRRVALGPAAQK